MDPHLLIAHVCWSNVVEFQPNSEVDGEIVVHPFSRPQLIV